MTLARLRASAHSTNRWSTRNLLITFHAKHKPHASSIFPFRPFACVLRIRLHERKFQTVTDTLCQPERNKKKTLTGEPCHYWSRSFSCWGSVLVHSNIYPHFYPITVHTTGEFRISDVMITCGVFFFPRQSAFSGGFPVRRTVFGSVIFASLYL